MRHSDHPNAKTNHGSKIVEMCLFLEIQFIKKSEEQKNILHNSINAHLIGTVLPLIVEVYMSRHSRVLLNEVITSQSQIFHLGRTY